MSEIKKKGYDEETGKYYDVLGNIVSVGDICARIYQYTRLDILTAKSLSDAWCTFHDRSHSRYDLFISLDSLGIKGAKPAFKYYSHAGKDNKDAIGNVIHIGDTVMFIGNQGAYFRKGTVKNTAKQKLSININGKTFLRYYSDVISLTAYNLENIEFEVPSWCEL